MCPVNDKAPDKLLFLGLVGLGLAHELTSPLTTTALSVELLLDRLDSDAEFDTAALRTELSRVHDKLAHMGQLVRRFRALARHQKGRHTTIDLEEIVDEAIATTRHAVAELSSATLIRGPKIAEQTTVSADSVLLIQAISCLILNAADALNDQSKVGEITLQIEPGPVLTVRDNGPGFDVLETVLTPGVSTKGDAGMGVGLALAKLIAADSGATLCVQNANGAGAIVTLQFQAPE